MSTTELRRAGVLARVAAGTLKLGSAARLLEVSYRQAKRLYRRYRAGGAKGLKHRSAGRASNRATDARTQRRVMQLLSLGQGPFREELHAFDAGSQARQRSLAVLGDLVNGLDDQAGPLPLAQAEVGVGLQDATEDQRWRRGSLEHPRSARRLCS